MIYILAEIQFLINKRKDHMQAQENANVNLCTKGVDHNGMAIAMICLQKQCTRKRLCCLTCIDELHCKHELISVKKFESYLFNTLNHNILIKNREQMLKLIVDTRSSIEGNIEKTRSAFNTKLDEVIKKLKSHFFVIESSFDQQTFVNVSQKIYTEFNDEKIQEIFKLAKKVQNNLVKSMQQINKAISSTDKLLNERLAAYIKQMDKHNDFLTKAIQLFKITGKSDQSKFAFNPDTKAICLALESENKIAKRVEGAGGYPIALVNTPFSQTNPSVSFTILEQPANKGIWMGVCALDIVKNFNFQSCYGIGKGTWAIDQVGQNHASAYSWNHHDTNYNSTPKVGWQFSIGDVVTIRVDFEKSIARFSKSEAHYYEQPIKLDLGPLYAFAGPTNLNDAISIV